MLTTIAELKKEFFAYRNGIVADMLRKNGDPHAFIMGCQLVDVLSIVSRYNQNAQLASELWHDTKHRECRMAATMLYPTEEMDIETAKTWGNEVECNEIADVLCHRLLRKLPYAYELAQEFIASQEHQVKYTGYRLILNLLLLNKIENKNELKTLINSEKEAQCPRDITQLLDSISEEL